MDNLSDSTLKLKYNKCKLKLKVWESNYRNKTGKNPSKDDIKEAPLEIRDAYKWYWQIKIHSLGQDSLLDATFVEKKSSEDEASESSCEMTKGMLTPLECQERAEEPKTSLQSTSCSLLNEAKILSDQTGESAPQRNESEPQPAVSLSDTIWGSHLNKTQSLDSSAKSTKSLTRSSSSFQLSEKLFLGAKFKKRNPRKSLSFSVGRGKEKGNLVSSESFSGVSGTCSSTDFSQGTEDGFPISDLENELSVENIEKVQNCDFVMVKRSVSNMQPISAVQKMMEDDSKSGKPKIERNLDKGWLERVMCTDHILNLEARENKDAAFSSMPSEDSDEDIIYASDNESNSPRKMEKEEKARLALRSNTALEVPAVMQKCNEKPKVMSALEKNDEKFRKRKVDAIEAAMALLTEKRKLERVPPNKKYKTSNEENEDHVNSPNENSTSKTVLCKKSCKLENSKKESLEKRVANGTINENFVRINVKKKVFVRGKKTMNFQKYKKQQWKNKKKELSDQASAYLSRLDPSDSSAGGGLQKCFKCGDVGHFAKQCTQMKGDSLMPNEDEEVEESPFPSLADVEKMAKEKRELVHYRKMSKHIEESSASTGIGNSIQSSVNTNETLQGSEILGIEDENISFEEEDDRVMNVMKAPTYEPDKKFRSVDPLYLTKADGSLQDTPSEVFDCLKKFGHKNFRPGQEVAIMRILSGLSTLVTLCTGSGKSLCYQLPAYLYASKKKCITLVVSPLVSLMDDQISGLPSFINGAALHTNQTEKQREKVIDLAKSGKLQFLLVSPEAVVAGERQSGFGSLLRSLPDIAFACIDEAHCVSQWSHNFRPSYLVLFKVLREKLGVQTILGLTATATQAAVSSIIDHIEIPDGRKGVIQDTPLPNNLILTVSCDSNRETGLLNLLLSSNFEDFQSVIVYCTRREECERLATLLRTCLKDSLKLVSGKGKLSAISEAYHAGLSAARRKQVQAAFMNGNVRIVVATVAFGMGINKADIRSVIHFNMPRNFESYVQEVGRSGRDGEISRCHLFLSSEGKDLNELRRHIHADSVDRHSIRKLLQRVFVACKCGKSNNDLNDVSKLCKNSSSAQAKEESTPQCVGHEVAFSVDETVAALDLPEENITTLLCYLELHDKNLLEVLPKAYTHCRIQSYKGMAHIRSVARTCPPLAMAIAMNYMSGKSDKTCLSIEFPVVEVASLIDWESGIVKKELRNLEWTQVDGRSRRSGMKVEFFNLGFRVKAPGNLSPEKLDAALDFLFQRVTDQEQSALFQLQTIFCAVTSVSYPSVDSMLKSSEADVDSHSNSLKSTVRAYFQEHKKLHVENLKTEEKLENGDRIASDVKQMVNMYRDCTFTGRAVARIFHGISSPNYPAQVWGRCRFWRAHLDSDFKLICLLATRVLLKMR